uniref:C2H2-type domain-containing protein n=1 Tax=Leptobrachium leishanense TaxID=445787 RepID=A0A8C5MJ57_9ANUR
MIRPDSGGPCSQELTIYEMYKYCEEHVVVKKSDQHAKDGSLKTQRLLVEPPPSLLVHERCNEQKILELTTKIIHLLTGEVWQYLEGHKDLYNGVISRNPHPLNSQDLSEDKTSSETFDPSPPRLEQEKTKVLGDPITDSSMVYSPRASKSNRSEQSVQYEGQNLKDLDSSTLKECPKTEPSHLVEASTSSGEGCPPETDIYPPTEDTETDYQSTQIKEEPISCEEDLTNIDIYPPSEYLSTNIKEESWEEDPQGTDTYMLMGHSQAELSSSHILEQPSSSGEGDATNTDFYTPTYNTEAEYPSKDEEMSSNKYCVPVLLRYTRENSCTFFDHELSPEKDARLVQPKGKESEICGFSCLECGESFSSESLLASHQAAHVEEKRAECQKCFNWKAVLDMHPNVNTEFNPYSCSECGKHFAEKSYLPREFQVHAEEKPFPCPECGKSFQNQSNLSRHRQSHKGEKPYSCVECGKCFTRKSYLEQHVRTHTGDKPYSCSVCGKVFQYQSNFVRHRRIHMGVKPYGCAECGRCFSQKTHLEIHQTVHTGQKPFSCSQCGKTFTQKSHLFSHQRVHYP